MKPLPSKINNFEPIERTDAQSSRRGSFSTWRQWLTSFAVHALLFAVLAIVAIPAGVGNLSLDLSAEVVEENVIAIDTVNVLPALKTDSSSNESALDESFDPLAPEDSLDPPLLVALDSRADQKDLEIWDELSMTGATDSSPAQLTLRSNIPNPVGKMKSNAIRSAVNVGGVIDTIGQDISASLKSNRTLVVWLFDRSPSLITQRAQILDQLTKVYANMDNFTLGGEGAIADRHNNELLTQVAAFGRNYDQAMTNPVKVFKPIHRAISRILRDDSGIENVMSGVLETVSRYRGLSRNDRDTGQRKCNVVIVVITDEAGDDIDRLEETIQACQKARMPVYVIGVPAPFGERESEVTWADPDIPDSPIVPAVVNQGPETLVFERVAAYCRLGVLYRSELKGRLPPPVDSGFGPYALTRLSRETGGIFFAVHPNRNGSTEGWNGVATYASHLTEFYSLEVMKNYEPDYLSKKDYFDSIERWPIRKAIVEAGQQSTSGELILLTDRKFIESKFDRQVTQAKKVAAAYAKRMERIYQSLNAVEPELKHDPSIRWKANFSLAMADVEGSLARLYSWMALLEMLDRRRPSFDMYDQSRSYNRWLIFETNELSEDERVYSMVKSVKDRCRKLIEDHPDTPWASMARWQMETPFGFKATQSYAQPTGKRPGGVKPVGPGPPQRL